MQFYDRNMHRAKKKHLAQPVEGELQNPAQ